jgi:response regulator of citrate/malate metabolism
MPAAADSDTLRKALQAGFHGVLPKPFSAQAVAERAERILAMPMLWQEHGDMLIPILPKQA